MAERGERAGSSRILEIISKSRLFPLALSAVRAILEHMFDQMERAEKLLSEVADELDPDVLLPVDAEKIVRKAIRLERLAVAIKTVASPRACDSMAWKQQGERSEANWMAKVTGTSVGNAAGMLETGRRLKELSGTDRALRSGQLSSDQAKEIASTAAENPKFEAELLQAAQKETLTSLKDRCLKIRATSTDNEVARHEALHKSRYFRTWKDHEGATRLEGRLAPEAAAVILAALEPYKNQAFTNARKAGRRERYDAYAADALLAMARDARSGFARSGSKKAGERCCPSAMIHVRVDHSALVRGHATPDEVCEIPGIGPIPVATVKALQTDSVLSVIVTKGADIKAVCHHGRWIPRSLRTALIERDPKCVVPDCNVREHLEIDHIHPVSDKGPTQLDNLARLCVWHHYLKTHHGYHLSGGPGHWDWGPPRIKAPPARAFNTAPNSS